MELDPLLLSRLQFALTIMFHYLFPPLTIGLSLLMVIMEGMYLKTGDKVYENMARFWTKIFAVNFAMGVATGLVMEFEFGTNWSKYSRFVGDVFGSALAAEGIFAFFLESGFLSLLVFGWDRISSRMHFFSTAMVALGSMFSAVWIVIANSWQQTPAGFKIVGQGIHRHAQITDFWAMVFNPSAMPRLAHVLTGCFVLGAFFVMSISAYYILQSRHLEFAKKSFSIALIFGFAVSLMAGLTGDTEARTVYKTQPEKLSAFEGHYHTGTGGTPVYIFGVPDSKEKKVNFGLYVPGGLSFLLFGNFDEPVPGLDRYPDDSQPPVVIPFFAFHMMVGIATGIVGLTALGVFFLWRGTLFEQRWLLWIFVFAVVGPYIANQVGWIAAEVGRQPWIVYKLLRTADAVSPTVKGHEVLISIIMFSLIYALLFAVYLYVLTAKIKHGPEDATAPQPAEIPDLMELAARRMNPAGHSLTMVREEPSEDDSGEPKPSTGESKE